MATSNIPEDIKNEFNDVWTGINKLIDRVNKLENNNIPLEARVSGREILDYNEHFTKWNKNNGSYFGDFVLWCIHTTQGQEFVKKVARQ